MPDSAPITPEDLDAALDKLKNEIVAAIHDTEQRFTERLQATEERAIERMRDMQTEILKGFERYARSNTARMVRLEASDTTATDRLNTVEQRLLELEQRLLKARL